MNVQNVKTKLKNAGLDIREGQMQMISAVSDAVAQKAIAVIEGGTGIGKTLGYLIPALLAKSDKHTIVFRATAFL